MTMQTPLTAMGHQDILLVKAPADRVLETVARSLASAQHPAPRAIAPWRPGLAGRTMLRLMGIRYHAEAFEQALAGLERIPGAPPWRIHLGPEELLARPIAVVRGPHYRTADEPEPVFSEDVKVSIPADDPGWTLVEYVETVSGFSILGQDLSARLAETDVLYLHRSGPEAVERAHDFHLYRNGDMKRRILCHSTWPQGDPDRAGWEAIADGPPCAYEPAGLTEGKDETELLGSDGVSAIMAATGLAPQRLFAAGGTLHPVLFSRRPGGEPLEAILGA